MSNDFRSDAYVFTDRYLEQTPLDGQWGDVDVLAAEQPYPAWMEEPGRCYR